MTRILLALMWLAHFLPLTWLARLGAAAGPLAFWLIPERRHVTRVNLAKCFPHLPEAERERLARAHFRAFCRSFLDYGVVWWGSHSRIERLVRVEGIEHLRAEWGRPMIMLAPHFVGMDIAATRLSAVGDFVSMFANQKNPDFSALLRKGRTRFNDQRLVSRQEGLRPVIRAMREGRPFYYLPDQDFGARDALFVPFFGVPAATVTGPSRLARITGARVLPVVTRMLPHGAGYVISIEPPWSDFPSGDLAADTRRVNAYIESRVREMPEQYFWMHRRFKTRPPGEAGFY